MRGRTKLAAAFLMLVAGSAQGQNQQQGTPTRIRGTVEKFDGAKLVVKSRKGGH